MSEEAVSRLGRRVACGRGGAPAEGRQGRRRVEGTVPSYVFGMMAYAPGRFHGQLEVF
ncbi:MAG: hypothetical protein ACLQCU_09750 [Acidimicrobiales bacterium]